MDRRDFLKFFGAGATVVPIIGGMPHSGATATLIETAKVEPIAPKIVEATPADVQALANGALHVDVTITQHKPSLAYFTFTGADFVVYADGREIDVTLMAADGQNVGGHWSTRNIRYSERPQDCEFTIKARYRRYPKTR